MKKEQLAFNFLYMRLIIYVSARGPTQPYYPLTKMDVMRPAVAKRLCTPDAVIEACDLYCCLLPQF